MTQYLSRNISHSYLPPFGNNEGQMAPTVKDLMRSNPWDNKSKFDWEKIKKEWDKLAIAENKVSFLEASPPNIMRVSEILSSFPNSKYVFSISSPYPYIASCVYNYGLIKEGSKFDLPKSFDSAIEKSIEISGKKWIKKAKQQKLNIENHGDKNLRLTYEDFCKCPEILLEKLKIKSVNNDKSSSSLLGKKNSKVSTIIDMTPKHLSFLGTSGILKINNMLKDQIDLIEYFGYDIFSIEDCNKIISQNLIMAFDGIERRNKWRRNLAKKFRTNKKN